MNFELICASIRSLVTHPDPQTALERMATIAWSAEGLKPSYKAFCGGNTTFNYACLRYLRVCEAEYYSRKAADLVQGLNTETANMELFPTHFIWDKLRNEAASDIEEVYAEYVTNHGTGSRELTGKKGGGK
jgi:hypothetical protein